MDSQDSSAPPPQHLLHPHPHHPHPHPHHHPHQHQHQHQPLPHSHPAVFLGSHNQPQQYQPSNSYPLPNNNNNSVTTATSNTMNNNMMHPHPQNARFPFNTMATASIAQKPLDHHFSDGSPSGGGSGGLSIEPAKKKRGRPRKYSPDNGIGLGLSSPAPANQISSAVRVPSGGAGGTPSSETPSKRNRGRPPGSGKKQLDALGIPGVGFTPHVILVAAGEDIASKVMAFSRQGPRTVCILSANGSVSNVTLRQPGMSSGTVTYEGRFEIISLSGSMLLESDSNHNRIGGLNVSLAGSDGRVLGGGVAGILKAASLVQVIVGSFIADGKKSKSGPSLMPHSRMLNFGTQATGISPTSPGASSESAEENDDSPLNHGSGPYTNAAQPMQNIPMYSNMGWTNSMKMLPN